jgi:hypothetical protein
MPNNDYWTYNSDDDVWWCDTTAHLQADTSVVTMKTAKAIASDAPSVVYVSNGTTWVQM